MSAEKVLALPVLEHCIRVTVLLTFFMSLNFMALTNDQKKSLRAIGHNLNPVVTIAGNGLSDAVMVELNRALDDHELIKIKVSVGDRDVKKQVIAEILERTGADLAQQVGNTALLMRRNSKAKDGLSNLRR